MPRTRPPAESVVRVLHRPWCAPLKEGLCSDSQHDRDGSPGSTDLGHRRRWDHDEVPEHQSSGQRYRDCRGSIALAASKLGARDGRAWKYEDDTRAVDLSVFRADTPTGTPLDAEERGQAAAFVEALRGDDGRMITEMRLSDGYINVTKLCQSAGKLWGDYRRTEGNQIFLDQLSKSMALRTEAIHGSHHNKMPATLQDTKVTGLQEEHVHMEATLFQFFAHYIGTGTPILRQHMIVMCVCGLSPSDTLVCYVYVIVPT